MQADCAYSLLGMTNPPSAIVPDYTLPIHNPFNGICADYINNKHSLSYLPFAAHNHSVSGLPSWVVDWSVLDTYSCKIWSIIINLFKPSQQASQMPQVESYTTLRMMAYEVDQVEGTSDGFGLIESPPAFSWLCKTLECIQWPTSPLIASICPQARGGKLWSRTLSADCCWGANSARRLTRNDMSFFSSRILEGSGVANLDSDEYHDLHRLDPSFELDDGKCVPSDAHFNDILGMISAVLSGMVLFYSKKGYIGVAKQIVGSGDVVFLVPGCQVPMLMRDAPVGVVVKFKGIEQRAFLVVSFCYLHGAMDGEILVTEDSFENILAI